MLWFSSYVIVFEFSWKVKEKKNRRHYLLTDPRINDLVVKLNELHNIKYLLYADYLDFSHEISKRRAEVIQEKILPKWYLENGMEIYPLKTILLSFSLAHQSINPQLKYNGSNIQQPNKTKYFRVTFDSKLLWKTQISKVIAKMSERLAVLKHLAGSKWGCSSSTLNFTYKLYIQSHH